MVTITPYWESISGRIHRHVFPGLRRTYIKVEFTVTGTDGLPYWESQIIESKIWDSNIETQRFVFDKMLTRLEERVTREVRNG